MKDGTLSNSTISFISTADLPQTVYFKAVRFIAFMIENYYHMGYTHFLVGTNTDYDEVCARLILSLKKCYPEVKMEVIFGSRYKKKRFRKISVVSDRKITVSQNKIKYDIRAVNEYLMEHCDIAICCFPEEKCNDAFSSAYNKVGEKQVFNIVKGLCE